MAIGVIWWHTFSTTNHSVGDRPYIHWPTYDGYKTAYAETRVKNKSLKGQEESRPMILEIQLRPTQDSSLWGGGTQSRPKPHTQVSFRDHDFIRFNINNGNIQQFSQQFYRGFNLVMDILTMCTQRQICWQKKCLDVSLLKSPSPCTSGQDQFYFKAKKGLNTSLASETYTRVPQDSEAQPRLGRWSIQASHLTQWLLKQKKGILLVTFALSLC